MPLVFSIILNVIYVALLIVFIAMWARFVFDWMQVLNPGWRPRGAVVVLAESSYTITDPPIKALRRVIPPLRLGNIALDLSFILVFIVVLLLRAVNRSIFTGF